MAVLPLSFLRRFPAAKRIVMCPYPVIFLDGAAADLVYLRIAGVYGLLQFISWKLDNFNGLQVLDYPSVLGTGERSVV